MIIYFRFRDFHRGRVAMCNLVHNVETISHVRQLLTASGYILYNINDARESANCSFSAITHIPEKISRGCLQ